MSDDEFQYDAKAHKGLLHAINSLNKVQHIQKSSRNEPRLQQAEFELVKSKTSNATAPIAAIQQARQLSVGTNDLVKLLKTTKTHLTAGKLLKNVKTTKKVLEKPLEKTAAERIKRTLGYENVKKKLARWDAVVAKNRTAETHVFPLKSAETIYVNTAANAKPLPSVVKSQLRLEMEAAEEKLKQLRRAERGELDDEADVAKRESLLLEMKLTRDELFARRKELAYVKMRQSQKLAKARKQNKIKSKKYHKLLKRQKIQNEIKNFELLQKTDPQAALEKLDALEKSRVLERASLRHKNTGTWAKNLQMRAKYDKDVRKDLAEQLQISRELTDKKRESGSDNENENEEATADADADFDPFNPWCTVGKNAAKSSQPDKQANWRKYWLQRNEHEKQLTEHQQLMQANSNNSEPVEKKKKQNQHKQKQKQEQQIENGWIVEELAPQKNIDDMFDEKIDEINESLKENFTRILKNKAKSTSNANKNKNSKASKDELENLKKLSFKNAAKRPIIDEALNAAEDIENNSAAKLLETIDNATTKPTVAAATAAETTAATADFIEPNKLPILKLQQNRLNTFTDLNNELVHDDFAADEDSDADEIAERQKHLTIAEAFEDDDIIAEFAKDKQNDTALKNTEIELSMPGWGVWAGAGISAEAARRQNQRLKLKLAEHEKRRDENKGGLYINENASKHLRNHLVSQVPFPFTSVQEYEASVRAPIGRNFVPETAFRMLTRPAVITMKGQVIEPMNEEELVQPARRLRHEVDKRIKRLPQTKLREGLKPQ